MSKYAVITGASSGIGLEFAKILAADGYNLLLAARDKKGLQSIASDLQEEHNIVIDIKAIDLSEDKAADELWNATKKEPVDILINNAGFGDLATTTDADWDKLESMIKLNVATLTRLSQLAAINMKNNGEGKILNVASIAAFIPGPGMAVYYATKAYVLSFTEALSEELKGSGVSVTALCPGPTKTHFSKVAGADKSSLFKGNLPTAADVAEYGYKSLKAKKVVAVHGVKSKLSSLIMPRLLPRSTVRRVVNKIQNS